MSQKEQNLAISNILLTGKFTAEMDKMSGKEDCYTSSLIITNLASDDMRSYKLMAENIHGTDFVEVKLIIQGQWKNP